MEVINWEIIKISENNFQFLNGYIYYVNHLSHFEHYNHQKYSYNYSENITKIYLNYALIKTCKYKNIHENYNSQSNLKDNSNSNSNINSNNNNQNKNNELPYHNSTIAFIPFYGGRPPNVTSDLKVHSLGQGNSLVCSFYFIYSDYFYQFLCVLS